jgi:hypothetical protein
VIFVDEASNKVKIASPKTREGKFFKLFVEAVNAFYTSHGFSAIKEIVTGNEPAIHKYEKHFVAQGGKLLSWPQARKFI